MIKRFNPDNVPAPRRYSQGVAVDAGARWVHISGQVGVRLDGSIVETAEGQIEQAFANLLNMLAADDLTPADLVKLTVLLTQPGDVDAYRTIRDRMLGGAEPASTLIIVAGLAHPDMVFEVEAIAAQ